MKSILQLACYCIFSLTAFTQVAINTTGTAASANTMLDVQSTGKGIKIPRMTAAERMAIPVSIADAGLLVYDITKKALYMFDGKIWLPFAVGGLAGDIRPEPSTGTSLNGNLGSSCAISGDYAAIGAAQDSVNNIAYAGSVLIFQKINGSWVQKTRLVAPDAQVSENFGSSVTLEGDNLVIGTPRGKVGTTTQGTAYFFTRSGDNWTYQQKIFANDGEAGADFGNAVVLNGTTLYIGSKGRSVSGKNDQGVVYVMTRSGNNWLHATQLKANDGQASDAFGSSITASSNTVVVGANYTTNTNFGQGSVYIFVKNLGTYTLQKKISYPGSANSIYYGSSVSLDGDYLAVGAPFADISTDRKRGLVFVYKRTGTEWAQYSSIYSSTESEVMNFGAAVILRNGLLIVAAPGEAVAGLKGRGAVYVYKYDPGQSVNIHRRIIDADGMDNSSFGSAIDLSGNDLLIGARGARSDNFLSGSQGKIFFGQAVN